MTLSNLEAGRGSVAALTAVLKCLDYRFIDQPPDMELGRWIAQSRKNVGLSQQRLSEKAGIAKFALVRVERSGGNVSTLLAAMRGLDLTPALTSSDAFALEPPLNRAIGIRVIEGDCRDQLRLLPDNIDSPLSKYQTCITSPPYYRQRDYGTGEQIGHEETPEEFIENLVNVFREVRRVLADDGTLWLNIGDSFSREAKSRKALLGIPWRLALALQSDGWLLRQDIIVAKRNPLPEPVFDRCVRAHEYLFLFAKRPRYLFDALALRERGTTIEPGRPQRDTRDTHGSVSGGNSGLNAAKQRMRVELEQHGFIMRNKRSVWTISASPNRHGHHAAFPEDLVEPCILAGCPAGGRVIDPFAGTGTVGLVAQRLGRGADLIEISRPYAELARRRLNSAKAGSSSQY